MDRAVGRSRCFLGVSHPPFFGARGVRWELGEAFFAASAETGYACTVAAWPPVMVYG